MNLNTNAWNRARYTLYAPLYDQVAAFSRPRRRSIALLDPRAGERLLIDGAGTGADLDYLPPDVSVTATDLTPAMVDRVRARAERLGRSVDARVMDAHALDLPDASFDAAVLHLILAVVPDPERALQEVARVLRPGGRAVVFDKFLPEGRRPPLPRRMLNAITSVLFSDITRQLEPLVRGAGLVVEHREPAMLGGAFEIAILRKP